MSKELECLDRIDKRNYLTEREHKEFLGVVEKALTEYEAIKNAEPSEALECLEEISNLDVVVGKTKKYDISTPLGNYLKCEITTIKQALLKAQEPKHYLKWEDLEFKEETTYENVKMGGHIYELKYWKYKNSYKDFMGNDIYYYEKFVYLRGHKIECTEFFNDLRLERVVE